MNGNIGIINGAVRKESPMSECTVYKRIIDKFHLLEMKRCIRCLIIGCLHSERRVLDCNNPSSKGLKRKFYPCCENLSFAAVGTTFSSWGLGCQMLS
ncbi:hypothetical protein Tco_1080999 [Tanacetum coccineum]|uniref:Uncharacterized protein n=1 Tax=Tanacetum coccineum TaxID=301880 RepID=A0ABQ5HWG1_9ASTR